VNQRTQQCGQQSREQFPCSPSIMETLLLGSPSYFTEGHIWICTCISHIHCPILVKFSTADSV